MAVQLSYVRTVPGILKILEIVFSFIGLLMILLYNDRFISHTGYLVGVIIGLVVGILLMIVYVTGFSEALGPAMGVQAYFHLAWMMYICAYSAILLECKGSRGATAELMSAGIFGILLSLTYLVDGIHGFRTSPPMPFAN